MLLQDGGEVGLGYVVGEGTVAEDDGGFTGRGEFLLPRHDAVRQRFHVSGGDFGRQTNNQRSGTDAVNRLACDLPLLDRYAQIKAKF